MSKATTTTPRRVPVTPDGIEPRWNTRDGRWSYQAKLRGPGGRAGKWTSATFPNLADAKRWLAAERTAIARGEWIDPGKAKVTFGDWAERWMAANVALKPKTIARYRSILTAQILPRIGRHPIGAVDRAAVRALLADLSASGLARGSVVNARAVLSGVLGFAEDAGAVAHNAGKGVRLAREGKVERHHLSPDQVARVIAEIPEWSLVIRIAAMMGLRAGEIWALRVERVDTFRRTVTVRESLSDVNGHLTFEATKNYGSRVVPIPSSLVDALAEQIAGRAPGDLVFTDADGGPVRHNNWYRRQYRPALDRLGFGPEVNFHSLRHTCASLMLTAPGSHYVEVAKVLGHAPEVLLSTYAHVINPSTDHLAAAMDVAFALPPTGTDPLATVHPIRR